MTGYQRILALIESSIDANEINAIVFGSIKLIVETAIEEEQGMAGYFVDLIHTVKTAIASFYPDYPFVVCVIVSEHGAHIKVSDLEKNRVHLTDFSFAMDAHSITSDVLNTLAGTMFGKRRVRS